jgi:nitrate reductase gamma subunit
VESWVQFGRGPLFALAFSLMLLGIGRILVLTAIGVAEAYGRSWDRIVNWKDVLVQTVNWLFPVARLWRKRPVYSTVSVLFHAGLIMVPLFAAAHVLLWRRSVGFAWGALPQPVSDVLSIVTLAAGLGLIIGRVASSAARKLSGLQEYFWPILLLVPFATGFICSHTSLSPRAYQDLMFLHVYSADLIIALIPFTKIAHCILAPISHVVTAVAWKFPPGAGERVIATLGYADRPTWMPKSRLGAPVPTTPAASTAVPAAKGAPQEVTVP